MGQLNNILVYGAGMMGKGVAQVFTALPEAAIVLFDVAEADVLTPLRAALEQLRANGLLHADAIEERMRRVRFTTSMEEVRAFDPDIVVECVFEDMALKQEVFDKLEEVCRADTIFCTNTSVMSPTEISANLRGKQRFVGTHFWNPAALIPLVEVVKTADTDDAVAQAVLKLLVRAGKKAVMCQKDVPGFIANRMQHALWREALYLVEQGIADARTVDEAVKNSFGLRLPQLGPLENADMVGLDLTQSIHTYLLPHLCADAQPSPLLEQHLAKEEKGFKTGSGLQEWSAPRAETVRRSLNEYLIRMTNKQEEF